MGLPLLRKKLFHPRRFLYPTAILWELWCVPSAPSLPHFACVRSLHLGFSFIHQQGEQRTLLSLELLAARFTVWDLSGIFSSFGSQVLWHLGHCAVIGAPKAKPAEMHFLIPSLGRFWWGNILRRNFQCFSKFLKQLLPHPTSGCRLSRHCPVTLWIFGFLQRWGAVRDGCSLGKGSQEPRLTKRHQCISSRACWTPCAVPWPGKKINC